MKLLWVGDVHATVRELADCEALLDRVERVAREQDVDRVFFAGDLYDNFSLVNTLVMEFWKRRLARLNEFCLVELLKGNHDMSNDSSSASHALMAHEDSGVTVIAEPMHDAQTKILYMPFIRNPVEFASICNLYTPENTKLLLCHQDFSGARYENGFYSKEGVDPSTIPSFKVISGHIHASFEFGNVWYPGAPRWRTLSDAAMQDRFIYVFDIQDGEIVSTKEFRTGGVCRRIVELSLTPGCPNDLENLNYSDKVDYRVSITGPEEFVRSTEIAVAAKLPSARIASVVYDETVKLKESDGIAASFKKWFDAFNPPYGTPKDVLNAMVKDRIAV